MTEDQGPGSRFSTRTNINVSQSDIRPVVRAELNTLDASLRAATNRTRDRMSKFHIQDLRERIELILNPK